MFASRTWKRLHVYFSLAGLVRGVDDPRAIRRPAAWMFVRRGRQHEIYFSRLEIENSEIS